MTAQSASEFTVGDRPYTDSPSGCDRTVCQTDEAETATNWHTVSAELIADRVSRPLSAVPRPFLRWAGSKRALLHHVVKELPTGFKRYYEPFLGSGSLFFALTPPSAVLSDTCKELIFTWRAVRDGVEAMVEHLQPLKPDRDRFYAIRSKRSLRRFARAAEFIYLNKTCWNGLYRVNTLGQFNVPYGRPKTDFVVDYDNLRACAASLAPSTVLIGCFDFEDAVDGAERGDFVFFDPPYVTKHNDNGFIEYNRNLFSWADQERLAATASRLAARGVQVIVTNAHHNDIRELYHGFAFRPFERYSTLASDKSRRTPVQEGMFTWVNR